MEKRSGSPSGSDCFPQKKQKQRSENPPSSKVGLFCLSIGDGAEEIRVYALDIGCGGDGDDDEFKEIGCGGDGGEEEFKEMKPAVRIISGRKTRTEALCVKGCTLYLFEGGNPFSVKDGPSPSCKQRTVRKIVLTPEVLGVVNEEDIIENLRDMEHVKWCPVALLTPDGEKILVFSTLFFGNHSESEAASPRVAFELYDIGKDEWKTLPGLPLPFFPHKCGRYPARVSVRSYSFINESQFFLSTNAGGFILNLKSFEWTRVFVGKRLWHFDDDLILLCGGRIALLPREVHKSMDGKMVFEARDLDDYEALESLPFPLSEHDRVGVDDAFPPRSLPISFLPLQPNVWSTGSCDTCTLQAWNFPLPLREQKKDGAWIQRVHLVIDVRRISIAIFNTEVLKIVKARFDYVGIMPILALFPLP